MDLSEEVRKVSNQNHLNRAQTRALKKLKDVSPEESHRVTANGEESSKTVIGSYSKKSAQIDLKDLSGREIEGIAETGYIELTMGDVLEDSVTRRNLHEILKAANRAKDLVQQILIFSRQCEQERKPV